jgi:hypothetical protein
MAVLFLHLLATVARLAGPGGRRSVVAESVLVKHQLLILNRSQKRAPNLRFSDRLVAGVCALLIPMRLRNAMAQALEAESPQIVGHLSAGVGMTEERFDRGPQVVVAKAVRQMGEGAERLEECHYAGVAEAQG